MLVALKILLMNSKLIGIIHGKPQPKFQSPVQFVPMYWSPTRIRQLTYSPHLLWFNQPDNAKQANTSPRDAGAVWPNLVAKTCNIGSPAMASNVVATDSWL